MDPEFLWLWLAAIAQIWPLTWELPYVVGVVLKSKKKKTTPKKQKNFFKFYSAKITECLLYARLWARCSRFHDNKTDHVLDSRSQFFYLFN